MFELKLILQPVWIDTSLDIIRYLTETKYALSAMGSPVQVKADKLIYYILSSGSVRDSFARNTIIAAQSSTAQPHIPDNEGLQLYNHFDQLFVSKDEHATSLPIAQRKFHSLQQKNNEKASDYNYCSCGFGCVQPYQTRGARLSKHMDFHSGERPSLRIYRNKERR